MKRASALVGLVASMLAPNLAGAAPLFQTPARWRTSGPGVAYPDRTDPTRSLPVKVQAAFACIRFHESRNHRVDGSFQQGWYQFTPYIWWYATQTLRGLPPTPNQATGDQQSRVAVWYWRRNGGFYPEWLADKGWCW